MGEEAEFNGLTIKKGAKVTSANVEGQSFPNLQGLKQLIATEGVESGEVKVEGAKMETLNYTQKEDKDLVKNLPQKTKTKKFCINNLKLEEDTEINVLNVKNKIKEIMIRFRMIQLLKKTFHRLFTDLYFNCHSIHDSFLYQLRLILY